MITKPEEAVPQHMIFSETTLLRIVDSQAQKIAEQAKEIERLQYKSKALELRCQHGV